VLSAIVQEVAGMPVDEYLRPRLFEPLGITDLEWERDPAGVASGGNGLSMRPRDLLSFGVLYLQDGMWRGKRVLPAGWVQKASALHVRHAAAGEWNGRELVPPAPGAGTGEGYGYQFWATGDGIYNASGIFGQECMIFPEQGGVVVVTGAMGDGTYHDLPGMLREAFRTAFDMRGDAAETEALDRRIAQAREPERLRPSSVRAGFRRGYEFEPNEQGVRSLAVAVQDGVVLVTIEDERGTHAIEHGIEGWVRQSTDVSVWRLHHSYQDPSALIVAAAQWLVSPDVLELTWHFLESPFIDNLTLRFDGDEVVLEHRVNVNAGPTALPPARGRAVD
jgi:hypothetical protein